MSKLASKSKSKSKSASASARKPARRPLAGLRGQPFDSIRPGCQVTIVIRGEEHRGRAVMRGPHGWVLNLGGRYGTPGTASEANTLRVRCPKQRTWL